MRLYAPGEGGREGGASEHGTHAGVTLAARFAISLGTLRLIGSAVTACRGARPWRSLNVIAREPKAATRALDAL